MNAQAVIAARGGPGAKSRLASRLDPARREALVEAMLADMLTALAACPAVLRTYVTTPTPRLAQVAARAGATVILEPGADDLNAAFDRARQRIAAGDPDAIAVLLPGDLPRLVADDVEACLELADPGRLVLAPASADAGTGALVFGAALDLPLAFGAGSFGKHLAAARTLRLETQVVRAPGLGFDIDRPADLDALLALGATGRTGALLQDWRAAA